MKWRPGKEGEEVLTHPETVSSTTSCGHKIQPWRDGSCSFLWMDGLEHNLLPNISVHWARLLHWAPFAVGVSAVQLALGKTCQSSSLSCGCGDGTVVSAL